MHYFVLVIVLHYLGYAPSAVQVGTFTSAQSCLESKAAVIKQGSVSDAFCVQVDK